MATPSIAARIKALQPMSVAELRELWQEVFGEPTRQRHRGYLWKRLSWEIQRQHYGAELSPEAQARLDKLQEEFRASPPEAWFKGARPSRAPSRAKPARPRPTAGDQELRPGTILTRRYKGRQITVTVRGLREFECRGQLYRSLSAVAKAITGSHCSGVAFFGLNGKRERG